MQISRRILLSSGATMAAIPGSHNVSTSFLAATQQRETFELFGMPLLELPMARPFERGVGSGAGYDADGVAIYRKDGETFDHPVMQAQYGMRMVASYRATSEKKYLVAAVANGNRLAEKCIESQGRLYFPYPFEVFIHGKKDLRLDPPWYSGMAQGLGLALFIRLARIDTSRDWMELAEKTAESFLTVDDTEAPWTPNTDALGYLWFEEYPLPGFNQEIVNGLLFALFGVYEYWLETRDERFPELIEKVLTTAKSRIGEVRVPGAASRYGMIHDVQADRYHQIHIAQLLELYAWTGDAAFAQLADTFATDYPPYSIDSLLSVPSGKHEVAILKSDKPHLNFDSISTDTFSEDIVVRVTERRREETANRFWYRISDGSTPERWILETDDVHIVIAKGGMLESGRLGPLRLNYLIERSAKLRAGSYRAFASCDGEAVYPEIVFEISSDQVGRCSSRAIIDRRIHYLLVMETNSTPLWVDANEAIELDI